MLDSIKEAVDTLIKFIKTIYKTNNLIFKKDEEDIVYENLIYELSDIVIHHIYIDEKASYRTSIDVINDYMIENGMTMIQQLGESAEETTAITAQVGDSVEALKKETSIINKPISLLSCIMLVPLPPKPPKEITGKNTDTAPKTAAA